MTENAPAGARTLWTSVVGDDGGESAEMLRELLEGVSPEELARMAREAAREAEPEIRRLIRPYQTKVRPETWWRILG